MAITWTILTQILLCLPASVLPGGGFLNVPYIDKIAHLGLFGGLVFFWILFLYFRSREVVSSFIKWLIVVLTIIYGTLMEYVQLYFVPNRSFDTGDIIADAVGALIGYIITQWFINWHGGEGREKNKPL